MRDACFAITGFFVVLAGFLAFVKPGGYEHAWLASCLLAGIALLIGLFLPVPQRSIQLETETFTVSVSLPNSTASQSGSLVPRTPPDMLSETRVHHDLQSLVTKSGRIEQYFELQRQRRQREKEIELVDCFASAGNGRSVPPLR